MSMARPYSLALLAVLAAGCGDPPPSKYPSQEVFTSDATLGPGDVLEVRVYYGTQELERTYTLGSGGTIAFPYIGRVQVAGRSQEDLEKDIQARLADGYLRDPIVSVNVKESKSKKISVFGQVKSPGTLAFVGGMSIIEAISQAGGFTPLARKNAVTVVRNNDGKQEKYTVPVESIAENKAANFFLRPGDIIQVPERRW